MQGHVPPWDVSQGRPRKGGGGAGPGVYHAPEWEYALERRGTVLPRPPFLMLGRVLKFETLATDLKKNRKINNPDKNVSHLV